MSYNEQVVGRMRGIVDEQTRLNQHDSPTRAQEQRFDALQDEFDNLKRDERTLRIAHVRSAASGGGDIRTEHGVPDYDGDQAGGNGRDQAIRAIERAAIPAEAQEKAEGLLRQGSVTHRSMAEKWIATTGSSAYERAFAALVADPSTGT